MSDRSDERVTDGLSREQVYASLGPFTNATDLRNTYADEIIRLRERVAALEAERDEARKARDEFMHERDEGGEHNIALTAQLARARELAKAAHGLLVACETADAREDLSGDVDGSLMEAVRRALPQCPDCDGFGTVDKRPHEDETIEPENQCPRCDGWGILAALSAGEGDA